MDRVNATARTSLIYRPEAIQPATLSSRSGLIPLTIKLPAQIGLQEVSKMMHLASRLGQATEDPAQTQAPQWG